MSSGAGPRRQQVAEGGVVALAERPVERGHGARGVAQRAQLVERHLRLGGDLGVRRRPVELGGQRVLGARDLALVAHEVDRQLDRAGLRVHPALDRLADPPRRVGGEAVAAAPVELLDRADQPEDALLDQVEQRELRALVLLRDRDDEPEVRVDHPVLGGEVAALDPLGEVDLLGGRQQPVAADLVEEELQRVGGRRGERGVVERGGLRVAAAVVAQVDRRASRSARRAGRCRRPRARAPGPARRPPRARGNQPPRPGRRARPSALRELR